MFYRQLQLSGVYFLCTAKLLLGFGSARAVGEVVVQVQPGPISIRADGYQAQIDPDGCLSSFMANGNQFLAPGVAISRGSYFYLGGPLKLDQVEKSADRAVKASGSQAAIEYDFDDQSMQWKLTNRTDQELTFFFVFSDALEGLSVDSGDIAKPAVEASAKQATFFLKGSALSIEGIDRVWGPWQGAHQVAEVSLAPNAERSLQLKVDATTKAQRADIAALMTPLEESDLVIHSPRNYQVAQRASESEGTILISGHTTTDADRVEYRIRGESEFGKLPAGWQELPINAMTEQFHAQLQLPAGGWYQLEVHVLRDQQVLAQAEVEKFGIGEVFVGAGQSNSTNCGQFRTQQTTGMVSSFGGESWQLADDPQPGVADRSQGGSFWPAFGDAMYEKYRVPIGVATTGFGGTSVNQWQPDGDLFKWTMTRIYQLGPLGFRAVLWHQGESDVQMPSDEYYVKLKNVILSSRARAGWDFPWFVAQASYHNPDNPSFDTVRSAQERLWKEGIALEGPDTDTLKQEYRDFDGAGIHFSPKGLKAHGEMWAAKVSAYVDDVLKTESASASVSR